MERLIRQRLAEDVELNSMLARFGNDPAIFYGKAPADVDSWEISYPMIILQADKFSDAQHGVAGLLTVDIICSAMSTQPEPLEKFVRRLLEGVFFQSDEVFFLRWNKSDAFQEQTAERTALIAGITMTFEIRELPKGETATPDPIQSLNEFFAQWDANLVVIGLTDFGEIFVPSRESPALWISPQKLSMSRQMYETAFVEAIINFHVFAPGVQIRREWLTAIYHTLAFAKAIPLTDKSPLRLLNCELDFGSDEIQGQLKTTWEFGIFKRVNYAHPLNHFETEHHREPLRQYGKYLERKRR